ncbi:MAG: hypothetical protein LBF78_10630 [Treponema sp.]|jgi:hypothetical protein|nr:hypothetical protein [Treponema sp.]
MFTKGFLRGVFVILLTAAAVSGLSAGAGAEAPKNTAKPVKIGIVFWQLDSNALLVQKYFKDYVGPRLNVEFMFSEAIDNADKLMTFMENAYAAGCQGIMNYQNSSIPQAIAKANELGMYIATQAPFVEDNKMLPYNVGFVAAEASSVAKSFGELVKDMLNDGQKHSIIIISAGSAFGNPEHHEATIAILQTLADLYGLKYTKEIKDLAVTRAETEAANDKNVKIVIYPGYPTGNTYVTGLSTLLQTGEYDTILACNAAYARCAVAIDEVEKAYKKNIRISAITMIDDSTKTSFTTKDSTGDSSLNSAVVTPSISTAAGLFALVYNGITGHAERMRVNNTAYYFNSPKWKCIGAEEYTRIEKVNTSDTAWEVDIDDLKKMLTAFNPQADAQSIYKQLESITAESVLKARGL